MTRTENALGKFHTLPKHAQRLLAMLSYRRPANSITEHNFIAKFIKPTGAAPDAAGNHWLTIGDNNTTLFSSHTDTVHRRPGMQTIYYGDAFAWADDKDKAANCLGADDTVGVWLMLEMIAAKKPGVYVFHRGEEIGGIGSRYIANKTPHKLETIRHAIAFDRAGTEDIITHQWQGRTASDAFAESLQQILQPLNYKPSNNGTFTDTANYAHLIPECTNIAVGYFKQHQKAEHLDIAHALALRDVLVGADFSKLEAHRKPQPPDTGDTDNTWMAYSAQTAETEYAAWIKDNASAVASFLKDCGIAALDIAEYAFGKRG